MSDKGMNMLHSFAQILETPASNACKQSVGCPLRSSPRWPTADDVRKHIDFVTTPWLGK